MNGQPLQWCKPLVHSFRDAYRLLCGCGTARNDNIEQPTRETPAACLQWVALGWQIES